VHRTAINSDYFKKISRTNVAFCDVAFFTLKNHVVCEMCNASAFIPVGKLQLSMHCFSRNSQI
jgi:hypothetical protein